jgi:hypothetical protein
MLAEQIKNRNFLSPAGFRFTLGKNQKVTYFCQSANIPGINVLTSNQPTPFVQVPLPAGFTYDDLNLTFLIDEDLENYILIQKWLRGLGVPDSFRERSKFERENTNPNDGKFYPFTDGTLSVLNSSLKVIAQIKFEDVYPISLSTLRFESTGTDTDYFIAEVTFKYKSYDVCNKDGISVL